MRWAWIHLLTVGCALAQEAPAGVNAEDAWRDYGKNETVCGQVVDTAYAASVPQAPTYLYLERPRPEQVFTVIIPASKRDLFGDQPEHSLQGKQICVMGKIDADKTVSAGSKHRASMVVEEEDQISVR